jgi:hypothetical protein
MELCECSLHDAISVQHRQIPLEQQIRIVRELSEAVAFLQEHQPRGHTWATWPHGRIRTTAVGSNAAPETSGNAASEISGNAASEISGNAASEIAGTRRALEIQTTAACCKTRAERNRRGQSPPPRAPEKGPSRRLGRRKLRAAAEAAADPASARQPEEGKGGRG